MLAYVNLVGGQDELVFDGDSIVVDAAGALLARGPQFAEELLVTDLDLPAADPARPGTGAAPVDAKDGTVITIQRLTLPQLQVPAAASPAATAGDRSPGCCGRGCPSSPRCTRRWSPGYGTTCARTASASVILGLSGGIDSALVATIAADAIGPDQVHVVLMPSRYSSDHSVERRRGPGQAPGPAHRDHPDPARWSTRSRRSCDLHGLAEENLQARVRGVILMGLSNAEGHLVLTTGNKSELATGYSTLYGDSAGGFAPDQGRDQDPGLGAGPLAQPAGRRARRGSPRSRRTRSPSRRRPSCAPASWTATPCPDYDVLDAVLDDYVEQDMGAAELLAAGFDPDVVERLIAAGRPGRVQATPVSPGAEDHARRPSAATAACRSPTAGASRSAPPTETPALRPPGRPGAPCWCPVAGSAARTSCPSRSVKFDVNLDGKMFYPCPRGR